VAKVLVIGAAGLLGREVVSAARERGMSVIPTSRTEQPGWLRFDAERDDPADVFREHPVDLVVNCAAILASEIDEAGFEQAGAVNARFPHALAKATAAAGTNLVHVSTDAVFAAEAGRAFEDTEPSPADVYGRTKLAGEPVSPAAITLRTTFVGLDPERHRGLLEWLLAQPRGSVVNGYVDHAWNGLASTQIAAVCVALADAELFRRARAEGGVHHLFEDPVISKHDLLAYCAHSFDTGVSVAPRESGSPVTRALGTKHVTLAECLQCVPPRARSLELLADRRNERG
jgi:dTDP-4-dehydrorhamnose reductase